MRNIEVVYASLCEANGAFLGKLREWLKDTDISVEIIPFDQLSPDKTEYYESVRENCFIDVFYNGERIDSVPLCKDKIYKALNIIKEDGKEAWKDIKEEKMDIHQFRELICLGNIEWIPITKETCLEEMSMCLHHYPYGNPPAKYHRDCVNIKSRVYKEVFEKEDIAGIYAKYKDKVIGLIEVFPREIIRKHGYLTGKAGNDGDYLTVGCYEIAYGIPRKEMIDELMYQLESISIGFKRSYIEGIGVYGCIEGFNPYWVYDKYGFIKSEEISASMVVLRKLLH